jgi:hypothetical protein
LGYKCRREILASPGVAIRCTTPLPPTSEGEAIMLYTILIVLLIIAVALFIWRNMVGRRA